MTLPQAPRSQRDLRVLSERFEGTGEKLADLRARDVLAYANHDDPILLRRLLEDIDRMLPQLDEISDHLACISRPATEIEVGDHLALVRINFHNSKAAGPYAGLMVDRAVAKSPSFASIEWATRHCIDTRKFMPVTAEVLEMIAEAQGRLNTIRDVIATLPARREAIAKRLGQPV